MSVDRQADFDVLVVADCRFAGGSTGALVADVTAMAALGLRVGLLFVRSAYLDDARDPPNPKALGLRDLDGVTALQPGCTASAPLVFLHHPLVFFHGIEETATLTSARTVVITHHPPFRADGSLEYDPMATLLRIRRALGLWARFAPISGVVRAQLSSFAPLIPLSEVDWPNIFDPDDWPVTRQALSGDRLTIGRHGRADPLKWPATGAQINASLSGQDNRRIRVLGCPVAALEARGADLTGWEVLDFGTEPVHAFLNTLDVFVYHVHDNWVEAFGRVVAEALFCGRICVLDPRLEATFGPLATYCTPLDTNDVLRRLSDDATATRTRALENRAIAIGQYGQSTLSARLDRFRRDPGVRHRGAGSTAPATVLRKLAGLYRRGSKQTAP